ncbi:conserved hypothetical protein [Frankia canadensis]|uniref:Thioesterase n=1 Tax=Frankia canadensis TaxID=1836972 RepID=A0A2I2KJR8_9ACTN|nr:conserved hypothetical protein [Frankia canadensis]SOU53203.1 conserved hypothetical protein [Frankia canadensis]
MVERQQSLLAGRGEPSRAVGSAQVRVAVLVGEQPATTHRSTVPQTMVLTWHADDGSRRVFSGQTALTLLVRPNDLDALGHVNNAVALEYLEAGRADWLVRRRMVPAEKIIAVVARIEVDYRVEVRGGEIEVRTELVEPTDGDFDVAGDTFLARFRQQIHRPDVARPAVEAVVTIAFVDARLRRAVTLQNYLDSINWSAVG